MKKKTIKVRITLIEDMLGMCATADIHEKYIASKAPDAASIEEEVEALGTDCVVENKRTVFPRENGIPILWDYQIKGMFKDSCGMLRRVPGTFSSQMTSYKKMIDGLMFPYPRKIILKIPDGATIGNCQRPLRADTAQGPRVAIADSESVPAGTTFEFDVNILEPSIQNKMKKNKKGDVSEPMFSLEACLIEWLDYGVYRGFGQWRNSGKGRFEYEILS